MKKSFLKFLLCSSCLLLSFFVLSCNDEIEIQKVYPFALETLPVPKKLKVGESAEIRCELIREGKYVNTRYYLRYFQPEGKGELSLENGTIFRPNDLYPLEKESFRLYYKSLGTESQAIDVYIVDSWGQLVERSFSFQHENSE